MWKGRRAWPYTFICILFFCFSCYFFYFLCICIFVVTFCEFVFLLDGRGRGGKVVKRWKGRAWSFYLCWHLPVIHCPHCILYFFFYFVFCIFLLSLLAPPGYTLPTLCFVFFLLFCILYFLFISAGTTQLYIAHIAKYSFSFYIFSLIFI